MKTVRKQHRLGKNATEYSTFIEQIQIIDLRLVSAKIDNLGYRESPPDSEVSLRAKAWYENAEQQIEVFHRYNLTVKDNKTQRPAARISVIFCLSLFSEVPMVDEIFQTFEQYNLRINTWPYLREFVHNTLARMNYTGLILPLYKTRMRPKKAK